MRHEESMARETGHPARSQSEGLDLDTEAL
jgi:hypothetical protein